MNCKQIREEIDAVSRNHLRGDFRSHLKACPDCRRYSDETASLLGLLKAQPRVEAPTDFEFRLRARIARAQAVAESDRQGFLRKILPETFSWGQMAAATAALALVVTVSTFHARRDDRAAGPGGAGDTAATAGAVDSASIRAGKESVEGRSPEIEAFAAESAGAPPVKFTSRSVRVIPASYPSEIPAGAAAPNDIADIDGSTRLYNPKTKRVLNDRSRFYGAETVSVSMSKSPGAVLTF
jgi:hypothetical protein